MQPTALGKTVFNWGARTYVMGILNITPDSFSGDGILTGGDPVEAALFMAREYLAAGSDILDVGGESTRPGSVRLDEVEEAARVLPVITALRYEFPEAVISIDTYKASVADQALAAGADMVNDVWGLRADPDLGRVVAQHNAALVLMHNRSDPGAIQVQAGLGGAYQGAEYTDLLEDVRRELMASVELARAAGLADDRLILDPGIGFGKTREQNMELIRRLDEVRSLGFPVLLGPSRKSFIGYTLGLPPEERVEGTAAAVAVGIMQGADIIRVHDVMQMVRVARMTDAITRKV